MRAEFSRQSVGLSPAHIELIKLLAAKAVEDFLAEAAADHTSEVACAEVTP
jgi:hypothetical protein